LFFLGLDASPILSLPSKTRKPFFEEGVVGAAWKLINRGIHWLLDTFLMLKSKCRSKKKE